MGVLGTTSGARVREHECSAPLGVNRVTDRFVILVDIGNKACTFAADIAVFLRARCD